MLKEWGILMQSAEMWFLVGKSHWWFKSVIPAPRASANVLERFIPPFHQHLFLCVFGGGSVLVPGEDRGYGLGKGEGAKVAQDMASF